MTDYPQHDKLRSLNGDNNTVGQFLEWLKSRYTLSEWIEGECENCGHDQDMLSPVHDTIEQILADYFEIDLEAYEAEVDRILEEIRRAEL